MKTTLRLTLIAALLFGSSGCLIHPGHSGHGHHYQPRRARHHAAITVSHGVHGYVPAPPRYSCR